MDEHHIAWVVLAAGALVALAIAVKALLEQFHLPAIAGYMLLGLGLRFAEDHYAFLGESGLQVFDFLAQLGIVALLFRVGLDSDIPALLRQLRSAAAIWAGGVALSIAAGYFAVQALGYDTTPALVVGAAFAATSVGIPVRVWQDHEALDTQTGERFLDAAELDDLTGVLLMALLFAVLPQMQSAEQGALIWQTAATLGKFFLAFGIFCGGCYLFSRYIEERLTRLLESIESKPDPTVVIAGIGMAIAAAAGLLGFSMAVGAFFAGLVFSRDPDRVRFEGSFTPIYEFLAPFFFIGVGLQIAPAYLIEALGLGILLVAAATVSKFVGHGLPALAFMPLTGAVVLGTSMIPRAEITMVIMQRAAGMGSDVMPDRLFSAMVFTSAVSATLAPIALHYLLSRWKNSCQLP